MSKKTKKLNTNPIQKTKNSYGDLCLTAFFGVLLAGLGYFIYWWLYPTYTEPQKLFDFLTSAQKLTEFQNTNHPWYIINIETLGLLFGVLAFLLSLILIGISRTKQVVKLWVSALVVILLVVCSFAAAAISSSILNGVTQVFITFSLIFFSDFDSARSSYKKDLNSENR